MCLYLSGLSLILRQMEREKSSLVMVEISQLLKVLKKEGNGGFVRDYTSESPVVNVRFQPSGSFTMIHQQVEL